METVQFSYEESNTLEQESGIDFQLPWSEVQLINYIVLQAKRGLMMSSVRTYLSRIRAAHIHKGFRMIESGWCFIGLAAIGKSQVPPHYHDTGQMLKEKLVASPWRQEKRSSGWPPALPPMVP